MTKHWAVIPKFTRSTNTFPLRNVSYPRTNRIPQNTLVLHRRSELRFEQGKSVNSLRSKTKTIYNRTLVQTKMTLSTPRNIQQSKTTRIHSTTRNSHTPRQLGLRCYHYRIRPEILLHRCAETV